MSTQTVVRLLDIQEKDPTKKISFLDLSLSYLLTTIKLWSQILQTHKNHNFAQIISVYCPMKFLLWAPAVFLREKWNFFILSRQNLFGVGLVTGKSIRSEFCMEIDLSEGYRKGKIRIWWKWKGEEIILKYEHQKPEPRLGRHCIWPRGSKPCTT